MTDREGTSVDSAFIISETDNAFGGSFPWKDEFVPYTFVSLSDIHVYT